MTGIKNRYSFKYIKIILASSGHYQQLKQGWQLEDYYLTGIVASQRTHSPYIGLVT
jgi:hypothetical protein